MKSHNAHLSKLAAFVPLVEDLLAQLEGTAVIECDVQLDECSILVHRSASFAPLLSSPRDEHAEDIPQHWQKITAPLSGIYYSAETPKSPPFVSTGETVVRGQVVGLIESMKMYNPVESDVDGTVRSVLVQNGKIVEKNQVLMYVEPRGYVA